MLKKLILVVVICISLSSCGMDLPKTVKLVDEPFEYNITIHKSNNSFKYNLIYRNSVYRLVPAKETPPIVFQSDGLDDTSGKIGENVYSFSNKILYPLPLMIVDILKSNLEKEISSNNDKYILHGFNRQGEYILTLDENANIKQLSIKSLNLNVDFE